MRLFIFISDIDIDQELEGFDMEVDPDAWRFDVSRCNSKYFHWKCKDFMPSLPLTLYNRTYNRLQRPFHQ